MQMRIFLTNSYKYIKSHMNILVRLEQQEDNLEILISSFIQAPEGCFNIQNILNFQIQIKQNENIFLEN